MRGFYLPDGRVSGTTRHTRSRKDVSDPQNNLDAGDRRISDHRRIEVEINVGGIGNFIAHLQARSEFNSKLYESLTMQAVRRRRRSCRVPSVPKNQSPGNNPNGGCSG